MLLGSSGAESCSILVHLDAVTYGWCIKTLSKAESWCVLDHRPLEILVKTVDHISAEKCTPRVLNLIWKRTSGSHEDHPLITPIQGQGEWPWASVRALLTGLACEDGRCSQEPEWDSGWACHDYMMGQLCTACCWAHPSKDLRETRFYLWSIFYMEGTVLTASWRFVWSSQLIKMKAEINHASRAGSGLGLTPS